LPSSSTALARLVVRLAAACLSARALLVPMASKATCTAKSRLSIAACAFEMRRSASTSAALLCASRAMPKALLADFRARAGSFMARCTEALVRRACIRQLGSSGSLKSCTASVALDRASIASPLARCAPTKRLKRYAKACPPFSSLKIEVARSP